MTVRERNLSALRYSEFRVGDEMIGIRFRGFAVAAAIAVAAMFGGTSAQAVTVKVTEMFVQSGNDCSGLFGQSFNNCVDPDGSPVLAKTDSSGKVVETNTQYPNILGSMFTVKFDDASKSSGTWVYDPGTCSTCKVVTSWVVKAGSGSFLWFHTDPKTAIYSGDWYSKGGKEMSHITFYDTQATFSSPIPVPASLPLMLTGLAAIGLWRRRTRKSA
jgi:hypothetical protein